MRRPEIGVRSPHFVDEKSVLTRAAYVLFGTLAALIGLGIVAWMIYNVFVERQPEFEKPTSVLDYFLPVVMISVGISMIMKGVRSSTEN